MIILVLILLGLCFGSFVNALVWRLHEQEKIKGKGKSNQQKGERAENLQLSILKGRSMCVHCHHTLSAWDLIPVFSWLGLRGKCRYCHKPISWQYPVVELVTAALFVVSYTYWPLTVHDSLFTLFPLWLIFLVGFMALAVYDLRWMILPDKIVLPLQVLAVMYVFVALLVHKNDWHGVLSALLGVLCSAGLFYTIFQLSQGKWIGGGDVKLAVVLGLLLGGALQALLMLFIASLLGSLVGGPMILWGKAKRNTKLPFGPFLLAATVIVYLCGASFIAWYKKQLLFG